MALEYVLRENGLNPLTDVNMVTNIDFTATSVSGRRACLKCGATYHVEHIPPKKEGVCDDCGSELVLRDDDKAETVSNRLKIYHDQTQPLIDYYTQKGILKTVDGTMDMKDVFGAIKNILAE